MSKKSSIPHKIQKCFFVYTFWPKFNLAEVFVYTVDSVIANVICISYIYIYKYAYFILIVIIKNQISCFYTFLDVYFDIFIMLSFNAEFKRIFI